MRNRSALLTSSIRTTTSIRTRSTTVGHPSVANSGRTRASPATPSIYGGRTAETNRPLNRYVGAVEVFHCPADHGDALNIQVKTCWEGWGNSYLVEWSGDAFRVKQV